jgi:hypothetical protein
MGRLNKPAIEGYEYRSPGQTNAKDRMPNFREDVVASQKADIDRIKRSMDTSATRPQNLKQVQEMGGRGISRTLGRAGAAGTALMGGYDLGRAIDEKTGIGKKMVDKVMGPAKVEGDRVELSEDSKKRIARGDLDKKEAKDKDEGAGSKAKAKATPYPKSDIRETSEDDTRSSYKDTEGSGDRSEESSMKKGGKVKKFASGGSVSASRRGDGCAQRGKTRGMMR